jgi:hypothetical protein
MFQNSQNGTEQKVYFGLKYFFTIPLSALKKFLLLEAILF